MDNFNKELFIDEVKKRPVLWDTECPEYLNRMLKKQAWKEVTDMFANPNDSEERKLVFGLMLQKKWKNLKDTYIKEYKKLKNNTSGIGQKGSNYIYFSRLSFLQKCIDGRNTGSPFELSELDFDEFSDTKIVRRLNDIEKPRNLQDFLKLKHDLGLGESTILKDIKAYEKLRLKKDYKFTSERKEEKYMDHLWNQLCDFPESERKKIVNYISKHEREHNFADSNMDVDRNSPLAASLRNADIATLLNDYTLKKNRRMNASREEKSKNVFLTNEDEDKMFCLSLYKELKKIPESNRLTSKIELLNVLKRAQVPSISSYGVPCVESNKAQVFIPPNYTPFIPPYDTCSFEASKEVGSVFHVAERSPFLKYIQSKSKSSPVPPKFKGWKERSSEHLNSGNPISEKPVSSPADSSLSSVDMNE